MLTESSLAALKSETTSLILGHTKILYSKEYQRVQLCELELSRSEYDPVACSGEGNKKLLDSSKSKVFVHCVILTSVFIVLCSHSR
jgi:hypothetical protein